MAAPKVGKIPGKVRKLGDKVVTQVLYNGKNIGAGKYFTGTVDGQLICDEAGKPVPFTEIGELVAP